MVVTLAEAADTLGEDYLNSIYTNAINAGFSDEAAQRAVQDAISNFAEETTNTSGIGQATVTASGNDQDKIDAAIARVLTDINLGIISTATQMRAALSAALNSELGRIATSAEMALASSEVTSVAPAGSFENIDPSSTPLLTGDPAAEQAEIPLTADQLSARRAALLEVNDPEGTFRRFRTAEFPDVGGLGQTALENQFGRALSSFELQRTSEEQIFRDFLRGAEGLEPGSFLTRDQIAGSLASLAGQDPTQLSPFDLSKRERFTEGDFGNDRTFQAAVAGLLSTVGSRFRPSVFNAAQRRRDELFENDPTASLLSQLQGGRLFERRGQATPFSTPF